MRQSDLKSPKPNIPSALVDVALIDAMTCAAPGAVSVSWWHAKVAAGDAPQPVVRMPRFTRWSMSAVRDFWAQFAEQAKANTDPGDRMSVIAKRASAKAREPAAVAKAQATRKARIKARNSQAGE